MASGEKFYWLKLKRDFFKRHDIRIIESMPNGKEYVLFYLKLLVESVDHDGSLRFNDQIPYSDEMLSAVTNTNIDIVRAAVNVFVQLNMMEMLDDGTLFMRQVESMVGSAANNDNANRQRRFRERKKQLSLSNCYTSVTKDNESKSIEKELEIDIIPSPNGEGSEDFSGKSSAAGKGDMQKAVDAWNSLNLKSVTKLTPDTERYVMLKKRIADYGIDEVLRAIENVRTSPFLNGHNKKGFLCTFDWFLKPNNFPKVLDGNYNDGEAPKLDPRAYDGARWLASQIAERVSGFQTPTPQELDRWARDLDALHRHGYTWKQISDTAVWAMDDDFWSSVITSGEALRKNFVKLMAKEAATRNDD